MLPNKSLASLSSQVTGELVDDLNSWDVLRAALPVGTVSGAPKVTFLLLLLSCSQGTELQFLNSGECSVFV